MNPSTLPLPSARLKATRRIEAFGKRFGKTHLNLAYHAALPLALTPDLLYSLWANFQRDIRGRVLDIPWGAVADVLLSKLCDEVGYELYEMDVAVRNELLSQLKKDENFGQQRIVELSKFLLKYIESQLLSDDPDIQDFAKAQKWTALAYTEPNKAACELAETLRELVLASSRLPQKNKTELIQNKTELMRMGLLIDAIALPLKEAFFEPLLLYARGMADFARGDIEGATASLSELIEEGSQIRVEGVILPIPQIIKAKS